MVFWINVPLGIVAGVMLAITLNEQAQKRPYRIDYIGSALMVLGTAMLMFAVVQAPILSSVAIVGLIVTSLLFLAALFAYERRAPEPMLPLKLFRTRAVA
jgi:4-hydroxybenzoate polyprenyltransferase